MIDQNVFRTYCAKKVIQGLSKQIPLVKWENERQLSDVGNIDVYGESRNHVYVIELEMRREDPVNNVVKFYRYADRIKDRFLKGKITFIHVFSLFYEKRRSKRENAAFIGEKMAKTIENVTYLTLDFNLLPPVAGDSFPVETDHSLKRLIEDLIDVIE
jgi:hypothetical protein